MAKNSQVQFMMEPLERQLGFAALVQQGNQLWLSGLISVNEKLEVVGPGDMAAQITQIYDLMEKVLAMGGATLEHVVNEVMYTTDLQALVAAAHVRKERYGKYAPPANTGVQVSALFLPAAMLEIQATAVLD
jgi:2-iminobutanoate/2-iminopropanoate deaminase